MKIAIEAQRVFRKKKHGMDIVVLELIKHLQTIDLVNEYFILVKPDEDRGVLTETPNFHIIQIPSAAYPVWEQISLPKVIKEIKPDLIHCTSNTAPLGLKIPLVLTLHDILYMRNIDFTKGTWYQRLGNLYRRWNVSSNVHNCNRIVTVSNFEKQEIDQQFALSQDRVRVVYNSFSLSFNKISNTEKLYEFKRKYGLPEEYVLYLGNTHPNKNIRNVLKGFGALKKRYKSTASLVMPDVASKFLKGILKEIGEPGLEESIHLTGYVPNDELVYIYNLAKIFIYPSFYESFGIPILEAMACGVPVIASDRTGMAEVAGDAAYLINPTQPDEIALAFHNLLVSETLRLNYIGKGIKRAASFNWENTAFQMKELYEEVFNQTNSLG